MNKTEHGAARRETCVLMLVGRSGQRIWGRTTEERLRLQFERAGVAPAAVDDPAALAGNAGDEDCVILVRANAVLDPPLVEALVHNRGILLMADNAEVPIAASVPAVLAAQAAKALRAGDLPPDLPLRACHAGELGVNFWKRLRKREAPAALLLTPGNRRDVEWRSFMGTYKGATDLVTKRVWPRPAFHVTRWLANTPVTPNMVTVLSAILVIVAFWLFWQGNYGWGLAAAWLMTFLDTVDGKLARTTLRTSRWGDILDHGIDLVHPPFWYWAWLTGLEKYGLPLDENTWWLALAVIVGGYVLQRILEGVAIAALGMEIHIWRRFDTFFREITARRNPNLVILTLFALLERPDLGILAVAWWTAISLIVHVVQIIQAFLARRRAGELVSWMAAGDERVIPAPAANAPPLREQDGASGNGRRGDKG
jgi:phosphatidylglycerophosphate synthase